MEARNPAEVPPGDPFSPSGNAAGENPEPVDPGGPPLVCIVGATATGKSAFALALAEASGEGSNDGPEWEIVSMDSMLVYRGMDIGTAKPSADELRRVPHHLLDVVEPSETYDVQRYLSDVRRAVAEIRSRGRRALFAGGTGFYLRALVYGLFEGPEVEPALRAALERRARELGPEALHAKLAKVDSVSAERIHPNDVRRVVRGLEVFEQTGRTLTDWQKQWHSDAPGRERRLIGLAPDPERLERRIRERTARMIDAGWPDEARAIRDGCGYSSTSIQALGYREMLRYADGKISRRQVEEGVALRTRQFARRQRTWYRKFPEIEWIDPEPGGGALAAAQRFIQSASR